jgi:hypothetical protein
MEAWNSIVRRMDTSPRLAEAFFRIVSRMRIKEKNKFTQRMGPEFESVVSQLSEEFDPEDVRELLSNDEFFNATMELQAKFRR